METTANFSSQPPSREGLVSLLLNHATKASTSTYFASFAILAAAVVVVTRIMTGVRYTLRSKSHTSRHAEVNILPYWVPYFGHAFQLFTQLQVFMGQVIPKVHSGLFGLNVFGTRIHVAIAPSIANGVFNVHAPVDNRMTTLHFFEGVMGDGGAVRKLDPAVVWGPVHKTLNQFAREPFLSHATAITRGRVERLTGSLISFPRSGNWGTSPRPWERAADVKYLAANKTEVAGVSLYPLLRDFVGVITLPVLMGERFGQNFPNVLPDLWKMISHNDLLLTRLPRWVGSLYSPLADAIHARERLMECVAEFEDALLDVADGKAPTSRWGDMSDVSAVMQDRAKAWRSINAPRIAYGAADMSLIWAVMANVNHIVFWMVWYIYSQGEELKGELRSEIQNFVRVASTQDTPSEFPELEIDLDGLMTQCPLLQSTFLEVMRMNAFSGQFKRVNKDFTVTESAEDAAILGKSGPQSYTLREGEMVLIPNGAHQMDERYWKNPTVFDPRRFWAGGKGEKDGRDISAAYKTMKVWGGGPTVCKGQKFAEREVSAFVAAILTLWEIEPVANSGKWVHPGLATGTGAAQPRDEVRVKMWQRDLPAGR